MKLVAFSKARLPARTLVRLSVGALLSAAAALFSAPPCVAQGGSSGALYQKPVSSRLNSSGRTIPLTVPLKDDGVELGDIVVRIDRDDRVLVPKAALMSVSGKALDAPTRSRIDRLDAPGGFLTIEDLTRAGIAIVFDRNKLELRLEPAADQRPEGELSVARRRPLRESASSSRPAILSGYLNVFGNLDHRWGNDRVSESTSARLELQSVFRLYNIVVENDLLQDGLVDSNVCPAGAVCTYDHAEGWKRRRSRVVYDLPESQLRLQVGDAELFGTGVQRTTDVLGVSIEKSPRKLQPGENIRPTGRSSFRLDRPSEVDVLVNGALVQKLRLRPGNYNLTDLPLSVGANEVTLRIIDDSGAERTLAFSTFYDGSLLGAGKNEWSIAAGLPSYFRDYERRYIDDDYLATAFYRQGLTDQVTAEVHAQADRRIVMGGVGVFAMTPWALFAAQGAGSESDTGLGYMVSLAVERSNAWGPFSYWTGLKESLRLGAEYRSTDFRVPGEFMETASGILYPVYPYWLRLHGSYSVPLPRGVTATLAGRYQFANDAAYQTSPLTVKNDRYGADLTLSAPLTAWTTGSLSVGYSNENYYWGTGTPSEKADFRVMARLYMRPLAGTSISASYDSLNGETQLNGRYESGRGIDRWETSVDMHQYARERTSIASASAGYWGNRFDARLSTSSYNRDVDWRSGSFGDGTNVTTMRVGTALAFADGAFAVGPPVRGHGFAIVEPHPSLAGKVVTVGTPDDVYAQADRLGPGLVVDLPAYSPRTLPIDVDDLPLGYSLGQGAFETFAPFRGGYRIVVGSDYSTTAFGNLVTANGDALGLASGTAYQPDKPDKQVAVFSNSAGRFSADGLAPGRWVLDMASEGESVRYVLDVPSGTDGLFRAGTLKPAGKVQ